MKHTFKIAGILKKKKKKNVLHSVTLGLSQIIEKVLLNVTNKRVKIGLHHQFSNEKLLWPLKVSVGHWAYSHLKGPIKKSKR